MRQGVKDAQIAQTILNGDSADLQDTTVQIDVWEDAQGSNMCFGEGRDLARRIGR
jgi:hypothetical protein